jgi:hypothetical protein
MSSPTCGLVAKIKQKIENRTMLSVFFLLHPQILTQNAGNTSPNVALFALSHPAKQVDGVAPAVFNSGNPHMLVDGVFLRFSNSFPTVIEVSHPYRRRCLTHTGFGVSTIHPTRSLTHTSLQLL